jgi:hypothetical protein
MYTRQNIIAFNNSFKFHEKKGNKQREIVKTPISVVVGFIMSVSIIERKIRKKPKVRI